VPSYGLLSVYCVYFKCFCIQLKGCPCSKVRTEVDSMISVLHLEDKRDTAAKDLSGGMKRKLCVGIALIAGSKASTDSTFVLLPRHIRLSKLLLFFTKLPDSNSFNHLTHCGAAF